jgi:small subunit ribosomal protein S20
VPKLKSSKKKMRQARAHAIHNRAQRSTVKTAVKRARATPTAETVKAAMRALDRGATKGQIHRNTAARKKSRLARLLAKQQPK